MVEVAVPVPMVAQTRYEKQLMLCDFHRILMFAYLIYDRIRAMIVVDTAEDHLPLEVAVDILHTSPLTGHHQRAMIIR